MFLRFFPLLAYVEHVADLARGKAGPTSSRHVVPWNKGTFLRFLGLVIRLAILPLPNLTWHWRWPSSFPSASLKSLKAYMPEVVFLQYWKFACIPHLFEALDDNNPDIDGRSATYRNILELLRVCCDTWQHAWNPGNYLCCDESMIFWQGTGEVVVIY